MNKIQTAFKSFFLNDLRVRVVRAPDNAQVVVLDNPPARVVWTDRAWREASFGESADYTEELYPSDDFSPALSIQSFFDDPIWEQLEDEEDVYIEIYFETKDRQAVTSFNVRAKPLD